MLAGEVWIVELCWRRLEVSLLYDGAFGGFDPLGQHCAGSQSGVLDMGWFSKYFKGISYE